MLEKRELYYYLTREFMEAIWQWRGLIVKFVDFGIQTPKRWWQMEYHGVANYEHGSLTLTNVTLVLNLDSPCQIKDILLNYFLSKSLLALCEKVQIIWSIFQEFLLQSVILTTITRFNLYYMYRLTWVKKHCNTYVFSVWFHTIEEPLGYTHAW